MCQTTSDRSEAYCVLINIVLKTMVPLYIFEDVPMFG